MIATTAGTTPPMAVSAPVTVNMAQGMAASRPPAPLTAACTSQSTVPLFFAMANR